MMVFSVERCGPVRPSMEMNTGLEVLEDGGVLEDEKEREAIFLP